MYFNKDDIIQKKMVLNKVYQDSEEKFHVSYGIDRHFLFGCGISIASILMNNKDINFTFHIFTDFFEEKDLSEFKLLCEQYNTEIIVYIISCDELKSLPSTKNWSYATYFRFIIADFLSPLVDRLLYLDADIICKGSLKELVKLDLNNVIAAAVAERDNEWWNHRAEALGNDDIATGYFNAGFLLLNLSQWEKEDISSQAMNLLSNDAVKKKISFLDQDILNLLIVNKVLFLGKQYNTQFSVNYELKKGGVVSPISKDTVLIHYIGPTKPWHEWSAVYPITQYFRVAQETSPWKHTPLLQAESANQLRYCAKHRFHQGKIWRGVYYFMLYFIKKIRF